MVVGVVRDGGVECGWEAVSGVVMQDLIPIRVVSGVVMQDLTPIFDFRSGSG